MDSDSFAGKETMVSAKAGMAPHEAVASPMPQVGRTPDQVFQEFKKSGFLDQLRRQMFDAFVASDQPKPLLSTPNLSAPSASVTAPQTVADVATDTTSATNVSTLPASDFSVPTASHQLISAPSVDTADASSSNQTQSDLGSKQALTSYLDTILRPQLEREHDRLRFQDPRNQLDTLLKYLDSEPVASATPGQQQDATLYEQLTAHVAKHNPETQAAPATKGILNKEGRVGKEVSQRIAELIAELLHPNAKASHEEEEDEDDDDDDGVDEDESTKQNNADHSDNNETEEMDI